MMFHKISLLTVLLAVAANATPYYDGNGGGGAVLAGSGFGLAGPGLALGFAGPDFGLAGPGLGLALAGPGLVALGGCRSGGCGGRPGSVAVVSRHRVNYVPVPILGRRRSPKPIFVDSHSTPVKLVVRSFSSPVQLAHQHIPSRGTYQVTSSRDQPHVRVHQVVKPVIQELREIITPVRLINQQILPVQEKIQTNVARSVNGGQVVGSLAGGQGSIGGLAGGDFLGGGGGFIGSLTDGAALLEGATIDGSGLGGFAGVIDGGLDDGCNGAGSGGSCGGDLVAVSGGGGGGGGHGKGSGKAIGQNGVPANY